jgi:hypothetical protein
MSTEETEEVAVQLRAGIESIPAQVPPGLAGRAYRGYRRRRAATRAAAAAGTATAAAVAVVLVATSAPRSAAPAAGPASHAPAPNSPLMSLAARITASSGPLAGDASLVISTNVIGGRTPGVVDYTLYTDSGAYYSGNTKQGLAAAVAHHEASDNGTDVRLQVAAARYAATGGLATARVRMATTEGNHLGLGLSPAKRKQIWDKGLAQAEEIFKEKGAKIKPPANPPTGKALQSDVDNLVWIDSVGALTEGGGDPQVRAGVLRLLSTISGVNVAKSTTGGQPTLILTWGPEMSGGAGKIVLVINAQTGMPISSWSGDEPPSLNGQPTLPSMTTFQVSRVTLAAVEAGRF